jgi:iron complex outermembrane recepter protein
MFDLQQIEVLKGPQALFYGRSSPGGVIVLRTADPTDEFEVMARVGYEVEGREGRGELVVSLNGAVNWNRGRYKVLDNVPCWAGQTIARGCNLVPNPTALDPETGNPLFTAQDLSGTPLIRAPEWRATFGFDYAFPVFSGWKLTVSNSNQFSSRFATFLARNRPNTTTIRIPS